MSHYIWDKMTNYFVLRYYREITTGICYLFVIFFLLIRIYFYYKFVALCENIHVFAIIYAKSIFTQIISSNNSVWHKYAVYMWK